MDIQRKVREGQQQQQLKRDGVKKMRNKRKFGLEEEKVSWKTLCTFVSVCERALSVTRGEVILSKGEGRKSWNLRRSCLGKK